MKKLLLKFGTTFMMLALVAAKFNVNATCGHHIYQEAIPESVLKNMRKYYTEMLA